MANLGGMVFAHMGAGVADKLFSDVPHLQGNNGRYGRSVIAR